MQFSELYVSVGAAGQHEWNWSHFGLRLDIGPTRLAPSHPPSRSRQITWNEPRRMEREYALIQGVIKKTSGRNVALFLLMQNYMYTILTQ